MSGATSRVLVVRLVAIGDVITAGTMSERLRRERPGARVTWLCAKGVAPLVRHFPGVAEVIAVDDRRLLRGTAVQQGMEVLRAWGALARRRFDLVLLAHADPRYRVLVAPHLGRAEIRVLERTPDPRQDDPPFLGSAYAAMVGPGTPPAGGRDWPLPDLRPAYAGVAPRLGGGRRCVAIAPGGTKNVLRENPLRRWPVERYAALARALVQRGHGVVLVGDAGDAWVRPHFAGIAVDDRIGALPLVDTVAMLRECAAVVTHDTGALHMARLVRAPIVALFGPTHPRSVVGDDDAIEVLWGGAELACRPCFDGREFPPCANALCMQDIAVPAVLEAIERAMTR
jgi:heptosyltransferase-2